jgi:hypothetical protein
MKKFDISDDLKNDILTNLVEPQYKKDIIRDLKLRKKFKNYGLFFETLSKFFVGVGSIVSFSSGIYKIQLLSFVAGTASVVSLVLLQYSSFSYREYKKISMGINEMLKKLNITTLSIDNLSNNGSELDNIDPGSPILHSSQLRKPTSIKILT